MVLSADLRKFVKDNEILLNPSWDSMLKKNVTKIIQFREHKESDLIETFKSVRAHWFPKNMIVAVDKEGVLHNSPKGIDIEYLAQVRYYSICKNYNSLTGTIYFTKVVH